MSAHTLRRWKATRSNPNEGYDVWWITAETPIGEKEICSVPGGHGEMHEAYAHLIAAAPELLKALKKLAVLTDYSPPRSVLASLVTEARAAIAKAEGR